VPTAAVDCMVAMVQYLLEEKPKLGMLRMDSTNLARLL